MSILTGIHKGRKLRAPVTGSGREDIRARAARLNVIKKEDIAELTALIYAKMDRPGRTIWSD